MRVRVPTKLLALAGMIGPVWFVTLVIVQGALQPDYSHVARPISALAAWPAGWLQNLNFFVFAPLMAAFVLGLHGAIRPTRYGLLGILLLLVSSVGIFLAGIFPWVSVNGVPTETSQHVVAAILTFVGAGTGLVVVSRRMGADHRWRDLAPYVLSSGIIMLALFAVLAGFAIDEGAALHGWVGLLQRAVVLVWMACTLVMAARVLRSE